MKQTRRKLIKSCLLREQPLPLWAVDGSVFGERGMALEFDRLSVRFIDIHHRYLELKQSSPEVTSAAAQFGSLIDDSRKLDQDILDWSTRLPSKWLYKKHTLPEAFNYSQTDFCSATVLTCAKIGYSGVWNEYHALRMLVLHTRLQILQLAAQPNPAETLGCQAQLDLSVNSLASLVPFCIGRIRRTSTGSVGISKEPFKPYLASLVVWPLSLALGLHTLGPTQRQWMSLTLARISKASSECIYAYAASDYWAVG